jgi:AcrR family transcriptional regulator
VITRPDPDDTPRVRRNPQQLPSGRHGLSRSFVERNQRERILRAVVEVVNVSGYAGLTVRDVIGHAGVSRRTFYEHFDNKEEVFVAAYELVTAQLADEVASCSRRGTTWAERVTLGLAAFLERFSEDPALAHLCVVEVLAAGQPGLAGRAAALDAFRAQLKPGRHEAPADLPVPTLAAEIAIGGAHEVIYSQVLQGRASQLPLLLPELLEIVLLPFLGAHAAAGAAATARTVSERLHSSTRTAS